MGDVNPLAFGDFVIDRVDERVIGPKGPLKLGHKAYRVLLSLAEQDGKLVTKDALFSTVWDGTIVSESVLASAIAELRRALGDPSRTPRYIESAYGRGYRMLVPVRPVKGKDHVRMAEAVPAPAALAGQAGAPASGEGDRPSLAPVRHGEAPSLAVLPFTNRSGVAEDEVFAIGMVEDLIDALSQGVHLRVIASSATARYRADGVPDLGVMARQLGVRYVMQGNVRRTGQHLRVTAQLVEPASGEILWTQKFERPLSELAALQEDLVLEVAAHLDSQVHRAEMERVLEKPADLTAWECVTRAVAAYRQVTPESLVQALGEAQRAVELSPDYGLAHAMLADARATIYFWTSPDDADTIRTVRSHIDRALLLEPHSAVVLAHVAEAFNYIGQPRDALRAANRAIHLRPNFGLAHYTSAVASLLLDRIDEALAHFDAELRAAPGSHTLFASYVWRGAAHVRSGDWEAAGRAYAQATQINPGASSGYLGEAFVAARMGRGQEARALMTRVRQMEPEMSLAHWERIMTRGLAGNRVADEVIRHLRNLWEKAGTGN